MLQKLKKRAAAVAAELQKAICNKKGSMYIDQAMLIVIAVVIGALFLFGLYELFSGTILPGLAQKIQSLFS